VNVQWGRIDTADVATVPLSDDERSRFALKAGDLLVCEGGAIGRAAIWPGGSEIAYQKALHRVRSRGDVELRWLRYLLEHYDSTGVLAARATGSTIKHLPQAQLRQLPVPLPARVEQRRIVDVLEDHLSRIEAGARDVARAELRTRHLEATTLTALFRR
jgi:type I restriction enzyme S subunit